MASANVPFSVTSGHAAQRSPTSPTTATASGIPASTQPDAESELLRQLFTLAKVRCVIRLDRDGDGARTNVASLYRDIGDTPAIREADPLTSACVLAVDTGREQVRRLLSPQRLLLAIPSECSPEGPTAIGLLIEQPDDETATIAGLRDSVIAYARRKLREAVSRSEVVAKHSAATVELLQEMLESDSTPRACQSLAARLADHLALRRVIVALTATPGARPRIAAFSDTSQIQSETPLTRAVVAAMEETIRGGELVCQTPGRESGADRQFLSQLAEMESATILAMPLESSGALIAVMDPDQSSEPSYRFLASAQPALSAAIGCIHRGSGAHRMRAVREGVRSKATIFVALTVACLMIAMATPVPYRVECQAQIEPRVRRLVAAPFDATLEECHVAPGDLVAQGDLLASLDGRELRWERASVQADFDKATKKRDSAQASRDYAGQRIAQLEIERLQLQLDLLDRRIGQIEIRSPMDGIVVAGDLQRVQGAPLSTGENLFEIAPLDEMTIETEIPDEKLAFLRSGQLIRLRLDAYPDRQWQTTIDSINPRSEIRDDQNVFIAESLLANDQSSFRPGMKGQVKVDVGKRRLGWILFHRPWSSLSRWFWW
ncbi:efflux RND transporter periplasmic adaptor subunit [Roseiconus nitratireducens]|uniref:Efflux RND transporter periplasmic adaptor subunit n=1 Tax=Roseiconus nitratireducens TaxID=2605748 RepID=A0A5M6CTK3_9BACT|nr:efflux RND transporter periplasmic adaptor subunit [Roseiconus nitratireducens]KAA5538544.1 efflux RND transporter periplasmic adaptor subunit [Roseiconus nitratireducens]